MLVATFRLDLDALALEGAFEEVPGMTLEAERVAAHSTDWTMPCIWIAADDFDAVDDALAGDESVSEIVQADVLGDEKYYHVDWNDGVDQRITDFVDHEGSVLGATATDDGWELEMRFVTRDQFDEFRATLAREDCSFQLLELYQPGTPRQAVAEVTRPQRDALVAAVERGYYEVPRDVATRELADELDVSHQSLSETLRRGTANLVEATLVTTPGTGGPDGEGSDDDAGGGGRHNGDRSAGDETDGDPGNAHRQPDR